MNARDFARKRAILERRMGHRPAFFRRAMEHLMREAGAIELRAAGGKVLGYQLPNGGVVCVKYRYRDALDAQLELARIARDAKWRHVPVREYHCQHCRGWHLTSQQKRMENQ